MRKKLKLLLLVVLILLLLTLLGFWGLCRYYRHNFAVNTWINNVYCTGKTVQEVNDELKRNSQLSDVKIIDMQEREIIIPAESIELYADYKDALRTYLATNQSSNWYENIDKPIHESIEPSEYYWNDEKLVASVYDMEFMKDEFSREYGCFIVYDENKGYHLNDGNCNRLDVDEILAYIRTNLTKGNRNISLVNVTFYKNLEDSVTDFENRKKWEQLNSFFDNHSLIYDMGAEKLEISNKELSEFLLKDENNSFLYNEKGELALDDNKITSWVENLINEYNTVNTMCEFLSTRGDIINVPYVTYGTELDLKEEKEFLLSALHKNAIPEADKIHYPKYIKEGYVKGKNDIGNTYIEVDMTLQHMYYYQDGTLVIDTDVVTGNARRKMDTPEGVNYVNFKQRNRVLVGPDYRTPVKYWMAIVNHVGIHDATWRKDFGGEIYKTNGSHGCINTPVKIMAELYDMVEKGTPVITFY